MTDAVLECDGHAVSYAGQGMVDWCTCTCGWSSNEYFDGAEWAQQEAKKHIESMRNPEWPVLNKEK